MAANLLKAGYELTVWARRAAAAQPLVDAGARHVSRGAQLAGCAVVIDMLQDISQIYPILDGEDGLLACVTSPMILVVSSTVAPQDVRDLAAYTGQATKGLLSVVDAPVSGGEAGAQAGTLSIMVGGDDQPVTKAMPVLEACGNPVHCGPLGAGEVVKACNQLVVGITMAALSEAALLAEGAGVDVSLMYRLLANGWGGSAVLAAKHTKVETRDYSNTGAAKFMVKDLNIALGEARNANRALPISAQALELYQGLTNAGLGDDDLAVVHKYLEQVTTIHG